MRYASDVFPHICTIFPNVPVTWGGHFSCTLLLVLGGVVLPHMTQGVVKCIGDRQIFVCEFSTRLHRHLRFIRLISILNVLRVVLETPTAPQPLPNTSSSCTGRVLSEEQRF